MLVKNLTPGSKYKTTAKQEIKVANELIDCKVLIPSGTVIVPVKVNEKSVRVEFRFRDKDKNFTARIPFEQDEVEAKEV